MLTERQLLILEAIIQDYTDVGRPIGSKALERQLPMHVSSATIRNEMSVLERLGLINKEHSSSGRVPSLKGYRYYVDNLVKPDTVDKQSLENIRASFGSQFFKSDEILAESAQILSKMTNYTAIAFRPESQDIFLQGFKIMPMGQQRVMVILVMSDGAVESQIFNLPKYISGEELEAMVRVINDQVSGVPINQVVEKLQESIPLLLHYVHQPRGFLDVFGRVLDKAAQDQFFIGGKLNLLNFVESGDVEQIKALYSLIDRYDDINGLINNSGENIQVKIGKELINRSLANYSLISATYDVDQHGKGLIALLGPTNMPYSKMIGLLGTLREELASRLLDYYNSYDD
ncbi:heat-inducible transcriptional repressor HrcA [Liquorilactobacillus capillatus]|uniref:Heat-inducible transcription repressor HrcA n=1 Tax=Liquorilactobacillus capillatus DSM 19910 TaxID=1423731 RepID=A0A0R1MCW5_9LACO|nr:heat-inducible transcriptional repressor HrcA [Liquorilactobacillus capillatus]KRL01288.1 heat-inducible transcription repressor [Liquorilactobacillus capillatus DSM 19910]